MDELDVALLAASSKITRHSSRIRGSIWAMTLAWKRSASGLRCVVWRGGSIISKLLRLWASWSGVRSSSITPPSSAENTSGRRATCCTSPWRITAQ